MQILNPILHNFDGVDVNEYCFTMPMENGRVVDLNHPQTVIQFKYVLTFLLLSYNNLNIC